MPEVSFQNESLWIAVALDVAVDVVVPTEAEAIWVAPIREPAIAAAITTLRKAFETVRMRLLLFAGLPYLAAE